MQYVKQHLNKHHLFAAPHKWFFAFLAAPIHFAELHYQRRYHMQFSHARKLFLFDLSLIALLGVIMVAWLGWTVYHPTVTDLVYISISPSKDRILSGEYIRYTVEYKNESEITLSNAQLHIGLPEGFLIDRTDPVHTFDREYSVFDIGQIESKKSGTVSLEGWFYGTPNLEDQIDATLEYRQDGTERAEKKKSPHLIFLRGSLLGATVEFQEQIIETSKIPFRAVLTNTGNSPLLDISFPFNPLSAIGELQDVSVTRGSFVNNSWDASGLLPGESAELMGILTINASLPEENYTIEMAPTLLVRGTHIPQSTVVKKITVAHPSAQVRALWEDSRSSIKPDETARLVIEVVNTGNVVVDEGKLEIPLPRSVVSMSEAARANAGSVVDNSLIITSAKHASLRSINPGESRRVVILIPIVHTPDGGTNLSLGSTVRFRGSIAVAPDISVDAAATASSLKVGTQLTLTGEVRYYTAEGDQLGRGPLPPVVGKETKYAALFSVKNMTSDVTNGALTVVLPPHVVWTGKASVTQGRAPTYNASNRTIIWSMGTISAHSAGGLFLELSLTPDESQIDTNPRMVESAVMSGFESYLEYSLTRSIGSIDASLQTDSIGRSKGTKVQ